ncbi:MAG TPA: hypothetical protein VEI97_06165 [bacterium]|nr:hypothetical protein [bacterium]
MRKADLSFVGSEFGKLVVEEYEGKGLWWCRCECGSRKLYARAVLTRPKGYRSCGCARYDWRKTHGATGTSEHIVWNMMRRRCSDPNYNRYADYGGRGIRVCRRWLGPEGFANFLADMGKRPSPAHKLDRIDNEGDYTPQNCRWATAKEQQRNMRSNHLVTYGGETRCLSEWAEVLGVHVATLAYRVKNWPLERAMTAAVQRRRHKES